MAFLTGNVTYQRFSVRGPKIMTFGEQQLERLKERALGVNSPANGSDLVGWAAGQHIWDKDFTELKNVYPDHLHFDFWTKVQKLPADRLKAYYETELKALSKDNPSGFPTAKQKREARGIARERLEMEGKDGRYFKWKCIPVLWDALRSEVYFGSSSESQAIKFSSLFYETFRADLFQQKTWAESLHHRSASTLATHIRPEAKHCVYSAFAEGSQDIVRWCLYEEDPRFLGNEFLVWLWHETKTTDDSTIQVKDGSEIAYMFQGGVRLEHPTETDNDTINSTQAISKPQSFRALQSGYLPRKAALCLNRHGHNFTFKLDAESFTVSALKLPSPSDSITDSRQRLLERLSIFRDSVETLDLLYDHFVQLRLSSHWPQIQSDIREWLKVGVKARG